MFSLLAFGSPSGESGVFFYGDNMSDRYFKAFSITPASAVSDTPLDKHTAIYVGGAGNLTYTDRFDTATQKTIENILAGSVVPVEANLVMDSSTASSLIALEGDGQSAGDIPGVAGEVFGTNPGDLQQRIVFTMSGQTTASAVTSYTATGAESEQVIAPGITSGVAINKGAKFRFWNGGYAGTTGHASEDGTTTNYEFDTNAESDAYWEGTATAQLTISGSITTDCLILITAYNPSGTDVQKIYAAKPTENIAANQFENSGTAAETAQSLRDCINDTTNGQGSLMTASIISPGVIALKQDNPGSDGNTAIIFAGDSTNLSKNGDFILGSNGWKIEYRQASGVLPTGSYTTYGDPIAGSAQPKYLNASSSLGSALGSGDIIEFRIFHR